MEKFLVRVKRWQWLAAMVLFVVLTGACGPANNGSTAVAAPKDCNGDVQHAKAAWQKLRRAYPFHVQGVAISDSFESGCRAVIVAEPPPGTKVSDLRRVAPDLLGRSTSYKHRIGVDGWTKDVVFLLPPASDIAIADIIGSVHVKMFGTSYQARALDWNPKRHHGATLDVRLDARQVHALVMANDEQFVPLMGGSPLTGAEIARLDTSDVYHSKRPGLVLWAIPQDTPIDQLRVEARQFAVDSDLIVGGFLMRRMAFVLGRERVVPSSVLPPLRFESLVTLAAANPGKLAQSYERQLILSGHMSNSRDWAPILLSPELRDTEFGSLLNIADQLLKGWSNNGHTHYANFDYPTPGSWEFDEPLGSMVKGGSLTYNFSTARHTYGVAAPDRMVIAFARTGALPTNYISTSGHLDEYEQRGHDFFARQNDPLLARVVQYASLYQIFKTFLIRADAPAAAPNEKAKRALHRETEKLLRAVLTDNAAERAQVAEAAVKIALRDNVLAGGESAHQALVDDAMQHLDRVRQDLLRVIEDDPDKLTALARRLAHPREAHGQAPDWDPASRPFTLEYVIEKGPKRRARVRTRIAGDAIVRLFGDLKASKQRYQKSWRPPSSHWIHTPSVVESWNSGDLATASGGHSLFSSPNVDEVSGEGELHSPRAARAAKSRSALSSGERTTTQDQRGALYAEQNATQPATGWHTNQTSEDSPSEPGGNFDSEVQRKPDGYVIQLGERTFTAVSIGGMMEVLARTADTSKQEVRLNLATFTPDEHRVLVLSLTNRMNAQARKLIRLYAGMTPEHKQALRQYDTLMRFPIITVKAIDLADTLNGLTESQLELIMHSESGSIFAMRLTIRSEHPPNNTNQAVTSKLKALKAQDKATIRQVAEECLTVLDEEGAMMEVDVREVTRKDIVEKERKPKNEDYASGRSNGQTL